MEGVDDLDPIQPAREGGAALDLDRLAAAEVDLASVEDALERLDAGTWGTCGTCGGTIDPDDLQQRPTERACPAHR